MNTFEHSPTTDLVTELLARIEHSNGLDFVHFDSLKSLHHALTAHLDSIPNPYIYDTSKPTPKYIPPRSIRKMAEGKDKIDAGPTGVDTPPAEINLNEFFDAKDYLRLPETATLYCRKRRDDYATLNSYMGWHKSADGAGHCHIYNLHIQRYAYEYPTWGSVTLPDGTTKDIETKQQAMAYILATYW